MSSQLLKTSVFSSKTSMMYSSYSRIYGVHFSAVKKSLQCVIRRSDFSRIQCNSSYKSESNLHSVRLKLSYPPLKAKCITFVATKYENVWTYNFSPDDQNFEQKLQGTIRTFFLEILDVVNYNVYILANLIIEHFSVWIGQSDDRTQRTPASQWTAGIL